MQFRGEYWFLSNFFPVPVFGYPSAEHAYQASKTTDREERKLFRTGSAAEAKRLGRQLKPRPEWAQPTFRLEVMEAILRKKFENPELRARLLATGADELVEENWWGDTFWGTCKGQGANHLGKLLMKIRAELQAG